MQAITATTLWTITIQPLCCKSVRALVRACVRMPELKSMATDADTNTYLAGDAVIRHVSVFGARGGRGMASDILIQAYENRNVGASVCNHGIGQTSETELFFLLQSS